MYSNFKPQLVTLMLLRQDEKLKDPKGEQEHEDDSGESSNVEKPIQKAFKIFRRNDDKFPYQALEVAQKGMQAAVKRFQKSPNGTTHMLMEIEPIPDGVSLFNLIKSAGLIQTNKNAFKSLHTQEILLRKIEELSWSNIVKESWTLHDDLAMSDDE